MVTTNQWVVGHDENRPPEEPLFQLSGERLQPKIFKSRSSMNHLEGEASLVKVEPIVGAFLKPPQSKCCSAVPTKSELHVYVGT